MPGDAGFETPHPAVFGSVTTWNASIGKSTTGDLVVTRNFDVGTAKTRTVSPLVMLNEDEKLLESLDASVRNVDVSLSITPLTGPDRPLPPAHTFTPEYVYKTIPSFTFRGARAYRSVAGGDFTVRGGDVEVTGGLIDGGSYFGDRAFVRELDTYPRLAAEPETEAVRRQYAEPVPTSFFTLDIRSDGVYLKFFSTRQQSKVMANWLDYRDERVDVLEHDPVRPAFLPLQWSLTYTVDARQ